MREPGKDSRHAGMPTWMQSLLDVAASDPERTAVLAEVGSIDASSLVERSAALARALRRRGVGPGAVVAIALPRTAGLVLGVLGVLRSGAAYLPIDTNVPRRTVRMLEQAHTTIAVTTPDTSTPDGVDRIEVDELGRLLRDDDVPDGDAASFEDASIHEDDLAYVIYTSGSTGEPKGVAVEHRALSNLLASMRTTMPLDRDDVVAAVSPVTFDMSIPELLHPLASGATVLLVDDDARLDPVLLQRRLEDRSATVLHATPSSWRALLADAPDAERTVGRLRAFVGAEQLAPDLALRLHRVAHQVVHLYGPTETTVWSSASIIDDGPVTLGSPLAGTDLVVLDDNLSPVAAGDVGELYIAGAGLARGYLAQPGLTAERFVASPFGPPGARMYRTGDRVLIDAAGALRFVGRADDQVKVRGHRIELREVEVAMASLPGVDEVAVVVRPDDHGGSLVAFIVPSDGKPLLVDDLMVELRQILPRHMLPSVVRTLPRLPQNARGKLDRATLVGSTNDAVGAEPVRGAPTVASLAAAVLGIERVKPDDNFFALGGHSLMAARLAAAVRGQLAREIRVGDVFASPTIAALADVVASAPPATPSATRSDDAPVEASFAQERLWFLDAQDPSGSAFTMPLAWDLHGSLDEAALRRAVEAVCLQHESLRTVVTSDGGRVVPRLLPDGATLRIVRIGDNELEAAVAAAVRHRFDLEHEHPTRWTLFTTPSRSTLVAVTHHIATDGWSEQVVTSDLARAYESAVAGSTIGRLAPALRYVDHARWERARIGADGLAAAERQQQLDFWRDELAGLDTPIDLPMATPRPPVASHRGSTVEVVIDRDDLEAVRALAQAHGATAAMVVQATLVVLLHRLGAGRDIALGALAAGRTDPDSHQTVGYFGNTWVLRVQVAPAATFATVLQAVRDKAVAAYDRLDVPFEDVVAAVAPQRSPAHHPLFQVATAFNESEISRPTPDLVGLRVSHRTVRTDTARFELLVTVDVLDDGSAAMSIEHATDVLGADAVGRLAQQLVQLLRTVPRFPDVDVRDLPLDSGEDRARWLARSRPAVATPGRARDLVALVHATACRTPDAVAVHHAAGSLTYRALVRTAEAVANELRTRGVGRGSLVGIAMGRTPALAPSILGVLRSGAAYLPLDPRWASGRSTSILAEAQPSIVLVDDVGSVLAVPAAIERLDPRPLIERAQASPDRVMITRPTVAIRPSDTAYVLYTSGSTGAPKGVAMSHATVVSDLAGLVTAVSAGPIASTLATSSINFDVSVLELFGTWHDGGTVHLVDGLVEAVGLTWTGSVLSATPSVLDELLDDLAATIRPESVVLAGEVASRRLVERARATWPSARLVNSYGQTESFYATTHVLGPDDELDSHAKTMPIGVPLPGVATYVLDEALAPSNVGAVGDLYVGGTIAEGYVGRSAETAARFVADPFGPAGARMLRTGDRARWTASGALEHVGRADELVKVRGVRIEPAEIVAALERIDAVVQAAVMVHGSGSDAQLVAFVTTLADADADAERTIRAQLIAHLPSNLLPDRVLPVARIPSLISGKIDWAALAASLKPQPRPQPIAESPRSDAEAVIAQFFGEVLGVESVGRDDNFFALGGHSLRVAVLASKIGKHFGEQCSMTDILHHPTPSAFAAEVVSRWNVSREARSYDDQSV